MIEEMKEYITPSMETIELEMEGFLAFSSNMSDDPAEDPAKARLLDDFDDEW
jgi:phosphatidate phosphatase APP1